MLKAIPMSLPIRAPVGVLSIELAREVKLTCLFERSRVTLAELEASISAQLQVSLNRTHPDLATGLLPTCG